jgi:hypothetical protein
VGDDYARATRMAIVIQGNSPGRRRDSGQPRAGRSRCFCSRDDVKALAEAVD